MRSVIRMSNIAFVTLLLSLLVFASQSVQAAPTVMNTADAGTGSLRQAIIDATTAAAATTIDFNILTTDPGYDLATDRFTITLLTPLPNLPLAPLTIDNAMGRGVTVKGGSSFRVFTLVIGAVVVINNLTISHGNVEVDVTLDPFHVLKSAKGGGIFMDDSATLTLNNCIVSDNTATNGGGGIWVNNSGTLTVFDSTISNNTATAENGGGIRINNSGTLNITRSTVSGNHADAIAPAGGGGGIYNGVGGIVNATNSTVNGNTAGNQGGGINNNATVTVSSSTISGNTATVGGGGIFNGSTSTATLNSSLVALNTGAGTPDLSGAFTANSSLIGNADGSTVSGANNQLGTTLFPINPLLGPLQNNGGPTFTRALLPGSPAIDTGSTSLPTDQRGILRPQDGDGVGGAQPDIGSFEKRLVELTAVKSRKTHGVTGSYDIPIDSTIALAGLVSVEPRTIGAGHTIVFQFSGAITATGTVATTVGSATAVTSGNDVVVTLMNVPDNTRTTVSLTGVNGTLTTSTSVGFLVGDVNNSRSVTATDILQVKGRSGQATDATNFRFDLNASGSITASDILAVKGRSGLVLP